MNSATKAVLALVLIWCSAGNAETVAAPTDPLHPGGKFYDFAALRRDLTCYGRSVTVFLPSRNGGEMFPAVVFGPQLDLELENYKGTLEHLAKKGVVAIFPKYDSGFFDENWTRMARDFVNLAKCAIKETGNIVDRARIVFSGHSEGAYVASIAAGLAEKESLALKPKGVVLLATSGFDAASARFVAPSTEVTIVYSDRDSVVSRSYSDSFYGAVQSVKKQFLLLKSYPEGPVADHFWPLTKSSISGGGREGPLHWYGGWKWLTAAALGLDQYLFGSEATDKGVPGFHDDVNKNF